MIQGYPPEIVALSPLASRMQKLLFPGLFRAEERALCAAMPELSYPKERETLPLLRPPRPPKAPRRGPVRKLWRASVKEWLENHDTRVDLRTNLQKERQAAELTAWFHALDVDSSGSIEEDEIRKFFKAMGMHVPRKQLIGMFHAIGKDIQAELTMNEFVSLMTQDPESLASSSEGDETCGIFDPRTRILMCAWFLAHL